MYKRVRLIICNNSGENHFDCRNSLMAHDLLAAYVKANWPDARYYNPAPPELPEDQERAIQLYFNELRPEEEYSMDHGQAVVIDRTEDIEKYIGEYHG